MRNRKPLSSLSRRERQIMEVLYRDRQATAGDVLAALPDPPGYSAVRAMLRILEEKGHVRHVAEGNRYVYLPTLPRDRAGGRPWRPSSRPSSRARRKRPSRPCSTFRATT